MNEMHTGMLPTGNLDSIPRLPLALARVQAPAVSEIIGISEQRRYRSRMPPRAMLSSFSKICTPASRMPQCRYSLVIHCRVAGRYARQGGWVGWRGVGARVGQQVRGRRSGLPGQHVIRPQRSGGCPQQIARLQNSGGSSCCVAHLPDALNAACGALRQAKVYEHVLQAATQPDRQQRQQARQCQSPGQPHSTGDDCTKPLMRRLCAV